MSVLGSLLRRSYGNGASTRESPIRCFELLFWRSLLAFAGDACAVQWLAVLALGALAFNVEVIFDGPEGHAVPPLHPAHLVSLLV